MSDEKLYTEREVVDLERNAFVSGACVEYDRYHHELHGSNVAVLDEYGDGLTQRESRRHKEAAQRYPLPKVTRPRVVIMQDQAWSAREWMYSGGNLMSRLVSNYPAPWSHAAQITPTAENIKALADLLANPTEEVDADV